jgi:hypothetical protein
MPVVSPGTFDDTSGVHSFHPASRLTAAQAGFFILSQSGERPERYVQFFRFDTILRAPSRSH